MGSPRDAQKHSQYTPFFVSCELSVNPTPPPPKVIHSFISIWPISIYKNSYYVHEILYSVFCIQYFVFCILYFVVYVVSFMYTSFQGPIAPTGDYCKIVVGGGLWGDSAVRNLLHCEDSAVNFSYRTAPTQPPSHPQSAEAH